MRYPRWIEKIEDEELKAIAKINFVLKDRSKRSQARILSFAADYIDEMPDEVTETGNAE